MTNAAHRVIVRPEVELEHVGTVPSANTARALSIGERLVNLDVVHKFSIVLLLLVIWELYTRIGNVSALLLPPFSVTAQAVWTAFTSERLLHVIWNSLALLVWGYSLGLGIAGLLTTFATATRFGSDVLGTVTAMFNPLPAIALLPLAMLWFGLGPQAIVFTLLHSVVWPIALNAHTGFRSVSDTQRMVGRNYGLKGLQYVAKLLVPAALPSILTGMRIAWAFAWRTLIAAELVFGGSVIDASGTQSAGLGWFIYSSQMQQQIPYVFAGLFSIIAVGLLVENLIFNTIERQTVRRWGMQA